MSMVPFTPLPDQQRRINELTAALAEAEHRGDQLEVELKAERRKNAATEKGVHHLRQLLSPFHQWMGLVFGEFDSMGVGELPLGEQPDDPTRTMSPRKVAVWESWIEKLGGKDSFAGKMISALLQHGALTSKQIAIHIGTKRMATVYEATVKVNKAGILDKNGDRFSLKDL